MKRALPLAAVVALVLPSAAAANPLYVLNQGDDTMSVIDTATDTVVGGPVTVGDAPFAVAVTPDGGKVYVSNVTSADVTVVEAATRQVVATVPLGAGTSPGTVAISPDGTRAYVALNGATGGIAVIDTATDTLTTVFPVGLSRALAVSPDGTRLYATNQGGGNVRIVDAATGAVLNTVPTAGSPLYASISPDGRRLWVANAFAFLTSGQQDITVVDTQTQAVVNGGNITSRFPFGVAVTPDGTRAYAINTSIFNLRGTDAVSVGSASIGNGLASIAISNDSRRAYVTSNALRQVAVVDIAPTTPSVLRRITVGNTPAGVALAPNRGPSARSLADRGLAGEATLFDARSSVGPDAPIARYDWDFGDGTTAADAGPTPTHIYENPGDYQVRLTVTDAEGCSQTQVFTGQTMSCNGGPKAVQTRALSIAVADPPQCTGGSVSVANGQPSSVALPCSGAVVAIAVTTPPQHGQLSAIDQTDGTVVYTPNAGYAGPDVFRFAATGPGGTSAPATVAITVEQAPPQPQPQPPLVVPVLIPVPIPPSPPSPPPVDRTPPSLTRLRLSGSALKVFVSKPATVTIAFGTARTFAARTSRAQTLRVPLPSSVAPGRYRVVAKATDRLGIPSRTLKRTVRVQKRGQSPNLR